MIIENRFLLGGYFAADDTNVNAEYPPPPTRFLAACLQVCCLNGLGRHRHVLEKLENLGPPHIYAGRRFDDRRYNNQNDKKFYVQIFPSKDAINNQSPMMDRKNELGRPVVYMKEPRVIYQWTHSNFSSEEKTTIDDILAEVTHLGRAESLVLSRRIDKIDWSGLEERYIPDIDGGNIAIKTPGVGSISDMCTAFDNDVHHDHWDTSFYRLDTQANADPSIWSEMIRFKINRRVHIRRTLHMIEAIRSQFLSITGGNLPPIFHGHGLNDRASHVAIMPLANVGSDYSRGMIKGFAVCLPRYITPEDRYAIILACEKLYEKGFHLCGDFIPVSEIDPSTLCTQENHWRGPSRRWASVTPVALDRVPKKRLGLENIIARMCEHIGLPYPREVLYQRMPLVRTGVPSSSDFYMKRKGGLPLGWGHVELVFDKSIMGPVILGQLRHFGMGVFIPQEDSYED